MANNKDVAFEAANVYISTNYVDSASNLPAITSANKATIIASIESANTFAQIGYARDINFFIDPTANAATIQVDNCDIRDIAQYGKYESRVEFEWLDVDDMTNLGRMLGLDVELDWTDQIVGFDVRARQIPYLLIKIVSCPNANDETTTAYFVKSFVDSEVQHQYHNFERVTDITGASMVIRNASGGKFIFKDGKQTDVA